MSVGAKSTASCKGPAKFGFSLTSTGARTLSDRLIGEDNRCYKISLISFECSFHLERIRGVPPRVTEGIFRLIKQLRFKARLAIR